MSDSQSSVLCLVIGDEKSGTEVLYNQKEFTINLKIKNIRVVIFTSITFSLMHITFDCNIPLIY